MYSVLTFALLIPERDTPRLSTSTPFCRTYIFPRSLLRCIHVESLAVIIRRMLEVLTFATDKRFGLVNLGVGGDTSYSGWEAMGAVIFTIRGTPYVTTL
jgi:hypothetical protein